MRPVILNGIEDLATRGDLLERAVLITLVPIPEESRRTEADFWRAYEKARPRILGALLNIVAAGLRHLPRVKLDRLPRMADFARWITACEPALGWELGSFLESYSRNVKDANELALGDSPLVIPLRKFMDERFGMGWTGTASDLLDELTNRADAKIIATREWPRGANALSGRLRRLAPNLRRTGIHIEFTHTGRKRRISVSTARRGKGSSGSSPVQETTEKPSDDATASADDTSNDPATESLGPKGRKERGTSASPRPANDANDPKPTVTGRPDRKQRAEDGVRESEGSEGVLE
jgi:hypothetical protein